MEHVCTAGLSTEVKLHVKKYVRYKAAVGNSLMIRDGVGLRVVTGNVRAYEKMLGARTGAVRRARFCDKRRDYTLSRKRPRYMSRGGSFPCSFALELQRESAFGGAFSASRARFLSRSVILAIPVFTCPLSFTRFSTISRSELKKRKYVLYITDSNMSIYFKLYVRYENSG